jgi:hypothetical protein
LLDFKKEIPGEIPDAEDAERKYRDKFKRRSKSTTILGIEKL